MALFVAACLPACLTDCLRMCVLNVLLRWLYFRWAKIQMDSVDVWKSQKVWGEREWDMANNLLFRKVVLPLRRRTTSDFTSMLSAITRLPAVVRRVFHLYRLLSLIARLHRWSSRRERRPKQWNGKSLVFSCVCAGAQAEHVLALRCGDGRDIAKNRDIVFGHETFRTLSYHFCFYFIIFCGLPKFYRHAIRFSLALHTNRFKSEFCDTPESPNGIIVRIFDEFVIIFYEEIFRF